MNSTVIASVADAFDALDLSSDNERISELQREAAKVEEAIARAQVRRDEISALLHPRTPALNELDSPTSLADALLADEPVAALAAQPKEEDLRADFARIGAGLVELRRREDALAREVRDLQQQAKYKVLEAARPLIDALVAEACEAGERIIDVLAALRTIGTATNSHIHAIQEAEAVVDALIVRDGHGGLLSGYSRETAPRTEVVELLGRLKDKGPALPVNIRRKVDVVQQPHYLAAQGAPMPEVETAISRAFEREMTLARIPVHERTANPPRGRRPRLSAA
jgi:hypothetical protein